MRAILSLATSVFLALGTTACSNGTSTTTSPSTTVTSPATLTFASLVAAGGSTSRSFTMSTAGTVKLTLATLGNGNVMAGLGIGVLASGAPCSLAQSVITGPGASPQITIAADAGTYCVQVFDPGTLRVDTAFSLTVEHP